MHIRVKKNCIQCREFQDIMSQFLEKHSIHVLDELEKHVESLEHCHSAQSQGNINCSLSSSVKLFSHGVSNIYSFSDILESETSVSFLDKSTISPLDPFLSRCVFSLDPDLSLSISFSLHSDDYESDLEVSF